MSEQNIQNQVPVKWVNPKDLHDEKPVWDKAELFVIPVVPLSALREVYRDYYIGLAALAQIPEDTLLRATVKTWLQHATQRLLASLGEVICTKKPD